MFQIGTGKSPSVSRSALCDEGHEFLSHCFQSNPNERWRAQQLLSHPFVKVCGRRRRAKGGRQRGEERERGGRKREGEEKREEGKVVFAPGIIVSL